MKKSLLVFFGLIVYSGLQAQNVPDNYETGCFFDINGHLIDGYIDQDYEPRKTLKVNYVIGKDYTPGFFYDLAGHKTDGFLKYSQYNTFFRFKLSKNDEEEIIKPVECKGYVIGADSFAVIQNFVVQREVISSTSKEREFAEVLDKVGPVTFYKHIRAGTQNIVTTYLVRTDTSDEYISFAKEPLKFRETAVNIFGSFESVRNNIRQGKYEYEDIPVLIKLLKYKYHFDNNKRIFFNQSWDEVDSGRVYTYYAIIDSVINTDFHLSYYFSNNIKIYNGVYSSFYPHKRTGDFVFYYPDGIIRKKITYIANMPRFGIDYFRNGSIHREYLIDEGKISYKSINDADGNSLIDGLGNGTEKINDPVMNREITYNYINRSLDNAYYINSAGEMIYQFYQEKGKLFTIANLQSKIDYDVVYPVNSIKESSHGLILVKCIIDPSGLTSEIQLVKGIDSACDSTVQNFLAYLKSDKCWTSVKVGGSKVSQEIVVPIDFSIEGFSRYRSNYYYNSFWMQQNMMRQTLRPNPFP